MALTITLLRIFKLLFVAFFIGGAIVLPIMPKDVRKRVLAFHGIGFLGTWAFGFGLAFATHQSILKSWVLLTILISIVSLNLSLFATFKRVSTSHFIAAAQLIVCFVSLVLMVMRP